MSSTFGVQRAADDHDRALAIGRDEHEVAGVRLHAQRGVDGRAGVRKVAVDVQRGIIDAYGGEEVDVGIALSELVEGDAAAAAGDDHRIVEMRDVARRWQRRHARDGDMLGMADDGDLHRGRL